MDLRPGQLVFGMTAVPKFGSLAEYVVGDGDGCVALPSGIDARDAATIGVASITAYQCIQKISQKERGGGKIFINGGSGGVGTYGIQLAKAMGHDVVTTCSARNVELCKQLGADEVIDYTKGGVADALIRNAREKGEFDLAIDMAGSSPLYWRAHEYLKQKAPFVSIAGDITLAGIFEQLKVSMWPTILGGGRRKYQQVYAAASARDYAHILEMMTQGKVKPVVVQEYRMADAPKAFEELKRGKVNGKLIIKVA